MKKYLIFALVCGIGLYGWSRYSEGRNSDGAKFVGNRTSMIFHRIRCRFVKKMAESNKYYAVSRDVLIKKKMRPAKCCKP